MVPKSFEIRRPLEPLGLDSGFLEPPGLHSGLLKAPGLDSGLLGLLGSIFLS